MCGIAGKFNYKSQKAVSQSLIKQMCDKMAYRGPDDHGEYVQGPVGLGQRRLSIIDLSEKGHQPMATADAGLWIVFNGEIYNFLELRKDLIKKGYSFKSDTDTEVILYLYREYGEECLQYLRGMFAFAIWDTDTSSLFLARDPIGKKPLFYYINGESLIFASEIKSILEDTSITRQINYEAFYDYFKYQYIPDPKTIYKNIFKLKPGHYLKCTKNGIEEKEYWDVSFKEDSSCSIEQAKEQFLEILTESVKLRMISDVPLGAFLSGGIDSSGIVALMAGLQDHPVTTCSIGFDSEVYDEIRFARTVADLYHTDHNEFTVKNKAEQILKDLAFHFDEPFADSSAVPTYYVCKLAREKVTVALSGDGGDENFAGYEKYYIDDIENRIRNRFPEWMRKSLIHSLAKILSPWNASMMRKGHTLLNTLSFDSDYGFYLTNTQFEQSLWDRVINQEISRNIGDYDPFSVTRAYYNKADTDNHLSKILYTDLKSYLPGDILVKVDRMSMAHSLEVRAPILDKNVIAFAASLPARLKYRQGEKKYIMKQAFAKVLPDSILYRKKMGFSVPLDDWFRGELKELASSTLFSAESGLGNFFNMEEIKRIWEIHQSEKRNYSAVLWSFLMFELWYKQFMA
ncbi:asparagine synthase (glutamine-hydrolyzing) [Desulfobacter sp.]|uniref:asparagine synthase (glutamine-hydrolyzing) n=1 Tax=Desulfobacter sp. TaxID=2294 RepID=UPI000E95F9CC|nr:asparagine synthase (glutamine-hydrolyzing) [Desulfobacter sp.]HBT88876.1 asparagine synthase (glutamine-hydrolyzing) [Desulfobacter sp.]